MLRLPGRNVSMGGDMNNLEFPEPSAHEQVTIRQEPQSFQDLLGWQALGNDLRLLTRAEQTIKVFLGGISDVFTFDGAIPRNSLIVEFENRVREHGDQARSARP